MMTLRQIREALKDRNLSAVARNTNLSYGAVWRIANGSANVTYPTVEALSSYLQGSGSETKNQSEVTTHG